MAVNMDTMLRLKVAVEGENNIRRLGAEIRGLQQSAAGVTAGFRAMQAASAALASSAVVAGLTGIIKASVDAGDELNNLQMKTGIAVNQLIGLRAAARLGDVDIQTLGKGINKLNIVIAEAAAGNERSAAKFKGLGVSIRDSSGQVASTDVIFKRLADRFRDMPDGAAKATAAVTLFGKSGSEFIPMLNEGSMAMDALNVKIGEDFAARSDQFNDTLTIMGLRTEAMGLQLTDALLPALQSILNEFNNLFNTKDDWSLLFESIKVGVRGLATFVFATIKLIDQLIKSVQVLAGAFGAITAGDFGGAFNILKDGWTGQFQQAAKDFQSIGRMWQDAPPPPSSARRGGREADIGTMRGSDSAASAGAGRGSGLTGGASSFRPSSQTQALLQASRTLGVNPLDLATIIGFETGGTYNPSQWGGAGGNYMGLIQFGGPERRQYGAYQGQSFEEQVTGPVVRFFQDRFKGQNMSTQGADLLTLYRTVLGGNPKANINGQDAFGTSPASGVSMMGGHRAEALRRFFGGNMANVGYSGADAASDSNAAYEFQQDQERQMAKQFLAAKENYFLKQSELKVAEAQTEEERLRAEYDLDRSKRMKEFISLQTEAMSVQEAEAIAATQRLEIQQAEYEYALKITDLQERQLAAITEMGDAMGTRAFSTPDIQAPGSEFKPFAGYVEGIGTMNDALNNLATTGFKGIEDAMVSLATTGKANFREFAAAMLEDTARIIIQQMVLKTILSAIGGIGGGGSNFSGIPGFNPATGSLAGDGFSGFNPGAFTMPALSSGFAFANGGAFSRNGIVPFARGGIVNNPTLFRFANGGSFGTGMMGEAGPEAIIPLKRGRDGRLGVSGGGDVSVSVQVNAGGTPAENDGSKARELGQVVAQAVKAEIVRQKRPGGVLS